LGGGAGIRTMCAVPGEDSGQTQSTPKVIRFRQVFHVHPSTGAGCYNIAVTLAPSSKLALLEMTRKNKKE
jgi:hypothetical protein